MPRNTAMHESHARTHTDTETVLLSHSDSAILCATHTVSFSAHGFHRFDREQRPVSSFAPAVEVRAVVEGQFLSLRLHASNVGITKFSSLLATGGASSNKHIVQVCTQIQTRTNARHRHRHIYR